MLSISKSAVLVTALSTSLLASSAALADYGYETTTLCDGDEFQNYINNVGGNGLIYLYPRTSEYIAENNTVTLTVDLIPSLNSSCELQFDFNPGESLDKFVLRASEEDPTSYDDADDLEYFVNEAHDGETQIVIEGLAPGKRYFFESAAVKTPGGDDFGMLAAPEVTSDRYVFQFDTSFPPVVINSFTENEITWTHSDESDDYVLSTRHPTRYTVLHFYDGDGNFIVSTLNRQGEELMEPDTGGGEFGTALNAVGDDGTLFVVISTAPNNIRTRDISATHSVAMLKLSSGVPAEDAEAVDVSVACDVDDSGCIETEIKALVSDLGADDEDTDPADAADDEDTDPAAAAGADDEDTDPAGSGATTTAAASCSLVTGNTLSPSLLALMGSILAGFVGIRRRFK